MGLSATNISSMGETCLSQFDSSLFIEILQKIEKKKLGVTLLLENSSTAPTATLKKNHKLYVLF